MNWLKYQFDIELIGKKIIMFDLDYLKKLALDIKFELSDEEAKDIDEEFETFSKQLAILDEIDTSSIEPMVYPFEEETSFLREDIVDHSISVEDALSNASDVKNGHFVVPRVVK